MNYPGMLLPVFEPSLCLQLIVNTFSISYFLGRLLRVDLIKWVSNVRPSTKSFFDFHEIWYVGRG